MRFSAAATMIASTSSLVLATPSVEKPSLARSAAKVQEERLSYSASNERSPVTRKRRAHWTMPRTPAEDLKSLPNHLASKSAVLTNQKEGEGYGIDKTPRHGAFAKEDQDLGILSPSRMLNPVDIGTSPNSTVFDSFTVFDRDRTAFYSICDPTVEDEYFCARCDTNATEKTVADFECQKVSCYPVDSRCPNSKMVVCRYDTMQRLFDYEPTGNASVPYESEKCRKIEARLSKTDKSIMTAGESSWDFSYCLRYNVASLPEDGEDEANTCEMEVDGVVCNSCFLETVDFSPANSTAKQQEFCVNFDCGNTLLGYFGRFCNDAGLTSTSIDYFIYRSLPCDGGCNLCGETDDPALMNMMTFPESFFDKPTNSTPKYLNTLVLPDKLNCFQTQWNALTAGSGLCSDLEMAAEESCGCMATGIPTLVANTTDSDNSTSTDGGEETEPSAGAMLPTRTSVLFTGLAATWLIGLEIL